MYSRVFKCFLLHSNVYSNIFKICFILKKRKKTFKIAKMRLSIEKRLRIITLYEKYALHFKPKRFEKLTEYAAAEEIFISVRRVRDVVNKWQDTGLVQNIRFENAGIPKSWKMI